MPRHYRFRQTMSDPETNWLYGFADVSRRDVGDLLPAMNKHGLSRKHRQDAKTWWTVASTFIRDYAADPRNLFAEYDNDAGRIHEAISQGLKRKFPFLSGRKILPLWLQPPPAWLAGRQEEDLWGVLALLDRGSNVLVMGARDTSFIYGANMAFRASVFHDIGTFRPELGPSGTSLLRGEDTEIMDRAFKAGKRVVYAPDAVVLHKVPVDRMDKRYFRRWKFHAGRSFARFSGSNAGRLPLWVVQECVASGARCAWAYCSRSEDRYAKELAFLVRFGRLIGSVEQVWNRAPKLA